MSAESLSNLLLALIAALPGVFAIWQQRRKTRAEATKTHAEAAAAYEGMTIRLLAQVEALQARVDKLERLRHKDRLLMRKWREGIEILITQLGSSGQTPAWQPDEGLEDLQ
jgi:hypothetical protein